MNLERRTRWTSGIASVFVLLTMVAAGFVGDGFAATERSTKTAQDWDMTWSGRVDAVTRITIRGRSARTRTISGQNTTGIRYNFRRRLPTNRAVRVTVQKRDGRGRVRVVQQPSRFNNFTAMVEIFYSAVGAYKYRIDGSWDNA